MDSLNKRSIAKSTIANNGKSHFAVVLYTGYKRNKFERNKFDKQID